MDVGIVLGSTFAAMVVVILCIGIAIFAVVYLRRKQLAKKVDLTRHVILVSRFIISGSNTQAPISIPTVV